MKSFEVKLQPHGARHWRCLSFIFTLPLFAWEKATRGQAIKEDTLAVAPLSHHWKLQQKIKRQLIWGRRGNQVSATITCTGQVSTAATNTITCNYTSLPSTKEYASRVSKTPFGLKQLQRQTNWNKPSALWLFIATPLIHCDNIVYISGSPRLPAPQLRRSPQKGENIPHTPFRKETFPRMQWCSDVVESEGQTNTSTPLILHSQRQPITVTQLHAFVTSLKIFF